MKALEKKHFVFLSLFAVFSLRAFCADQEEPAIDIPQEFEGVQDVIDLESGAAMEGELPAYQEGGEEAVQNEYASFLDSANRIRMHSQDSDVFLASHKSTGKRLLTSFANGRIQRRFYADDLSLEKIEYWTLAGPSAQGSLEREISFKAAAGNLRATYERNYTDSTETRTFFYSDGRIKSRRKNFFDKDDVLTAFEIFTCAYDSSSRLVQERLQKYSVNGSDVDLSSDELNVTKYSGKKISETSYYKNSILRVRTFYPEGNEDEYARATYFDGGMIVRDFYKGNIKISSTVDNGERREN